MYSMEDFGPGLAEDVLDGGLRHLFADHLVDHHLLDLGRDINLFLPQLVLDHRNVVLDGLGVPLAGDVQGIERHGLGTHPAVGTDPAREYVGRGAHVTAELLGLLAAEFLPACLLRSSSLTRSMTGTTLLSNCSLSVIV